MKLSIEQRIANTSYLDSKSECILCSRSKTKGGYSSIYYNGKTELVHRIVLTLAKGAPTEAKKYACHTCDNPKCINPNHLYWGSQKINVQDCISKGRFDHKGVKNSKCILTEKQILEIKYDYTAFTLQNIAGKYNISVPHVSMIKNGKRWAHILRS